MNARSADCSSPGAAQSCCRLQRFGCSATGTCSGAIPLDLRILLLTLTTCLPPAFVLSLISPVAIKLQLPDMAHTGRVAGLVYALGTLGSLVGNFLTGFVLLAQFTTYVIVLGAAGVLALAAVVVRNSSGAEADEVSPHPPAPSPKMGEGERIQGFALPSLDIGGTEQGLKTSPPSPFMGEGGRGGGGERTPSPPGPLSQDGRGGENSRVCSSFSRYTRSAARP